ncbi:hypothetical protein [Mesorhizobium sp. NPDC059025]|uniref:hypothetical protein n=1 Tax=unclassified Mesorhizobium TaxID=325217 RepID=UPI0036C1DB22
MTRIYTREEIYNLVWSTPISQVAGRFGLSDNGFAKICRKHEIPLPGRGYWAKIEAGHSVSKPVLPAVSDPSLHGLNLRRVLHAPAYFLGERGRAHLQHLSERRALAKRRKEREAARDAFIVEMASAQRKIDEFKSGLALLLASPSASPEYTRLVSWAKERVMQLQQAQAEAVAARLAEKRLFPEPDELYDPEGDPPSGSGVWD